MVHTSVAGRPDRDAEVLVCESAVEALSTARIDALSQRLEFFSVRSTVFCLSDFTAPWGFRVARSEEPKFHLVLEGEAHLEVPGEPPQTINAGELVLLSAGDEHAISDSAGSPTDWLDNILEVSAFEKASGRLRYGGPGSRTQLLCGAFSVEPLARRQLAAAVGTVGCVEVSGSLAEEIVALILSLANREQEPGGQAVLTRLSDALLAETLRSLAADGAVEGETRGESAIWRVAAAIRDEPQRRWELRELAKHAGMSRSTFSERFRAVVGQSPMRYVRTVRLQRAGIVLRHSDESLAAVAIQAGYESDAALSRAFRREFGVPPGEYRRRAREGDLPRSLRIRVEEAADSE